LYHAIYRRKNRTQSILFLQSLDQIIKQDNEECVIDLFVEGIQLADFKFHIKESKEGRLGLSSQGFAEALCIWGSVASAITNV
jgi:hypothetical protein